MGQSKIDEAAIRTLAAILHETDLSEIEIANGDSKLRIARQLIVTPPPSLAPPPTEPARAEAAPTVGQPVRNIEGAVLSPMVGTAYLAPEPGARAFVDIGDVVSPGQVLLIVEAMKTMNQIVAEVTGTVRDIFVEDGQPVEYGEPLLAIG